MASLMCLSVGIYLAIHMCFLILKEADLDVFRWWSHCSKTAKAEYAKLLETYIQSLLPWSAGQSKPQATPNSREEK